MPLTRYATKLHAVITAAHLTFTRFEALTDGAKAGFYPGVLVIEVGPAKGHYAVKEGSRVVNFDSDNPDHAKLQKYPIVIGEATIDDVVRCGVADEVSKAKFDHGEKAKEIIGSYSGFRRDGDKVRADLTLLDHSPFRQQVDELIKKLSKKIGNSIDFDYIYEIKDGNAVARVIKLNSVDLVDSPAATNSLFAEQPTNLETHMPLSAEDLTAIGGVIDTKLTAQETKFNAKLDAIKVKLEEGKEEDDDEDKKKKEKDADKAEMKTLVNTAALAALQSVLPKATLESLQSLSKLHTEQKDEYAEKVAFCKAARIPEAKIDLYIARTWPDVYTTKFGNGGGQKGSAKTSATI